MVAMRSSPSDVKRAVARALCAVLAAATLLLPNPLEAQQQLTDLESRIAANVDVASDDAIEFLRQTVDINSGTLNTAGVRRVSELYDAELRSLGFATRWVSLEAVGRAGHLVAERRGTRGKRLLLLGHMDTVFEEDSPFQRFEMLNDSIARGPGVSDMKGGNAALVFALRALHDAGALDNTTITVILTGDEERPGRPLEIARAALVEAARQSDAALSFEGGGRGEHADQAVVGRRSSSRWDLVVHGTPAHSSRIFSDAVGAGAIYEAARILTAWYEALHDETLLTFNPGIILGGSEAALTGEGRGAAAGKTNIVAERVVVQGDIRTISDEQLQRTRARMRELIAGSLPGTHVELSFEDGYPSMTPTEGNASLLARYDEISRALGLRPVEPFDPANRGAGDIAFVASYVDSLDGLGPHGAGAHTVDETLDIRSLAPATKRAALLIHRLTRE